MAPSPTDFVVTVAANVRAEMGRQRKNQADLAQTLGITAPTAARRLSGDVPFDVKELMQISSWLGVDLAQLTMTAATAVSA